MKGRPGRKAADLEDALRRLDGAGYGQYRSLQGEWDFGDFGLALEHAQPDPFAPPSRLRVRVPATVAAIPRDLHRDRVRRIAVQDFLLRALGRAVDELVERPPRGLIGGYLGIDRPGQEVLERTAVRLEAGAVEAVLVAGLPGHGRRLAGRQAAQLLCRDLPRVVRAALPYASLPRVDLKRFVETVEDQAYLRQQLAGAGLVAFVADGSILPRRSGAEDTPLPADRAVPFAAPAQLKVTLQAPNAGPVAGLGLPEGVTLIVGGGFHGKSTLLDAVERGVYDHVPGDGRERVVTVRGAVKVRAEDGRYVSNVDISPFIGELPGGVRTESFGTEDASGSTSQAAAIVEALECGATCLLMDEDTCASNFMLRDRRMQELVARDREPIVPFVDRVGPLWRERRVSTVLVMGGSGDYLEVADTVLMMDAYRPRDVTASARRVAARLPTGRADESPAPLGGPQRRVPRPGTIEPARGKRPVQVAARTRARLQFGRMEIDLGAVEQLVDVGQTRAIGEILVLLKRRLETDGAGGAEAPALCDLLADVARLIDREGLDAVASRPGLWLAAPRVHEVAAALNRLRGVKFRQLAAGGRAV